MSPAPLDLAGDRFGSLVAVEVAKRPGRRSWLCRCDCGDTSVVATSDLRSGATQSCGCGKTVDLTGVRIGLLVVRSRSHQGDGGRWVWECQCDCGNVALRSVGEIGSARRKGLRCHCGCSPSGETHGFTKGPRGASRKSRLYYVWMGMRQRCTNPNHKSYPDYGARGISVCDEWGDYECFRTWALSIGYRHGLTIERVDVDGDYCPDNCTWIPKAKQSQNTRRTYDITYDGRTQGVTAWANEVGLRPKTLRERIFKYEWTVEEALTTPLYQTPASRKASSRPPPSHLTSP